MEVNKQDILINFGIILLLLLMLDPFGWNMSSMTLMVLNAMFLIGLSIFATVVWKGFPKDEREDYHLKIVGSRLFLVQTLVLGVWAVIKSTMGEVDMVLFIILAASVLGKTILLNYSRFKN